MNILVLNKGNKFPFCWYMKQTEFVCLFRNSEGKAKTINNMSQSNLISTDFPKGSKRIHKCEKSVELIENFILQSSKENDLVLDPFFGSGTTAIACKNTNRNFIGFELDEKCYNLANNRLALV